jgi:hypothetical protein
MFKLQQPLGRYARSMHSSDTAKHMNKRSLLVIRNVDYNTAAMNITMDEDKINKIWSFYKSTTNTSQE